MVVEVMVFKKERPLVIQEQTVGSVGKFSQRFPQGGKREVDLFSTQDQGHKKQGRKHASGTNCSHQED